MQRRAANKHSAMRTLRNRVMTIRAFSGCGTPGVCIRQPFQIAEMHANFV